MKLYISGPMTGLPDFNYPAFNAAAGELAAAGFEVLNPVDSEKLNDTGSPESWQWYMRHALLMLAAADGVALLPGWDISRGARIEERISRDLDLPVRRLRAWLS